MSNLIPSSFKNLSSPPSPNSSTPSSSDGAAAAETECLACRISGTLTFAGVGIYALTYARSRARTSFGRAGASVAGLSFLAIAAVRWSVDGTGPEPVQD